MAAQHPPILVLSVSIVMVRFFGISRSGARYAERIVSHESVFRRVTALRVALFKKLSARSLLLARDLNSGSYVKAIVDDIERAQEYQLRVTLPRYAALISISFSIFLGFWIAPVTLVVLLPASIGLMIAIPAFVGRKCAMQSSLIEEKENQYAREITSAHFGAAEARIYGYQDRVLAQLHKLESDIVSAESSLLATIRNLQAVTSLILGTTIVGSAYLVFNKAGTHELPAVKISMAIFLPLVAFEGITNWYPNLFISGKLLRAQRQVDFIVQEPDAKTRFTSNVPVGTSLQIDSVTAAWDQPFMSPVSTRLSPGELLVIRGRRICK
jgi:ABC-type transport system involved in cytochrome bd biosynthesis fused ATPase/permease subunit